MNKVRTGLLLLLLGCGALQTFSQAYPAVVGDRYVQRQQAKEARVNRGTTAIAGGKWLRLKPGREAGRSATPDVVFTVKAPAAGLYQLATYAVPVAEGKPVTAHMTLQIDDGRPTKRIVYDQYHAANQVTGKFALNGRAQQVKIWLPPGIQLGYIEWKNYNDPAVPAAARAYMPAIVPPAAHPRLWVTPQSLPLVKARLATEENRPAWNKVSALAKTPFSFDPAPDEETFYREDLEKAVEARAFYYLVTGDEKTGNEAVRLMLRYMQALEFGNVTYGDITREIGRAIYAAALVYDWCYDLLGKTEKDILYTNMLRLARDMEIGWPPFMDSIINGHGNEAQICRDLLAMSMAVYNEDPLPYQYTSYTILEQLAPMRQFEYASPRHNQGVDYGAYRFGWEMHAVWLYYRMTGLSVFDDNIKHLPYYWLYMRLPDGYMLRDGDMFSRRATGAEQLYWKQPQTMLLSYAYANDPLIKGEFEREGGLPDNPVLYLLVNDPALKADHHIASLPLTKDFGTVLGSMVARTGWNNTPASKDVIAEIKGGGYHFANHQHADAGALQIFHHGIQVGDIGLYLSYGTPYDYNFNKRSVAHSMMLALDPEEPLLFRAKQRDGGTRFNQRFPMTPHETTQDPWFNNGQVLSADFGPSPQTPAFSYFKADLTGAYTAKMSRYTRAFCFLRLGREDVPAAIILADDMTTAQPSFQKYWQINTMHPPDVNDGVMVLRNELNGQTGKTYVNMLLPAAADRHTEVRSGPAANSTFGETFTVRSDKPEAHATRIMISPKNARARDRFLTVFQMVEGDGPPLPVDLQQTGECYQLRIADRVVCMSAGTDLVRASFTLHIPADSAAYQVALLGLQPGYWNVRSEDGTVNFNVDVKAGRNTVYFSAGKGTYTVSPGRAYTR
ncbi:hypothetical protein [Chitinophaga alhagiae]|uniref:hypothetical protein n=1 Tax=Chitinophaga alhagiae TaxID=2203219 RepID=UPI00130033C7|nr:hypothetical protein [Chitinophaga alhagiae]